MWKETYRDNALRRRPNAIANRDASLLIELVHPSASEPTMVSLITRHALKIISMRYPRKTVRGNLLIPWSCGSQDLRSHQDTPGVDNIYTDPVMPPG